MHVFCRAPFSVSCMHIYKDFLVLECAPMCTVIQKIQVRFNLLKHIA